MEDESKFLPDAKIDVQNLEDILILAIESYGVWEWHPEKDGKGKPTHVHLVINVEGVDHQFVMRFKSAASVDKLCMALQRHSENVWGKKPPS